MNVNQVMYTIVLISYVGPWVIALYKASKVPKEWMKLMAQIVVIIIVTYVAFNIIAITLPSGDYPNGTAMILYAGTILGIWYYGFHLWFKYSKMSKELAEKKGTYKDSGVLDDI